MGGCPWLLVFWSKIYPSRAGPDDASGRIVELLCCWTFKLLKDHFYQLFFVSLQKLLLDVCLKATSWFASPAVCIPSRLKRLNTDPGISISNLVFRWSSHPSLSKVFVFCVHTWWCTFLGNAAAVTGMVLLIKEQKQTWAPNNSETEFWRMPGVTESSPLSWLCLSYPP